MKPGNIQMKAGKWYITTAMRGFRPQKQALNGAFISTLIRRYFSEYDGTLLAQRAIFFWIPELLAHNYRIVRNDMKHRITNMPDCRLKRIISEWQGWLNYMVMVNTSKPKEAAHGCLSYRCRA